MKREWTKYLKSLGMSIVLVKRATQSFEALSRIWPEEIVDIFVSEYVNEDGAREFEDLYFFTACQVVQARGFALQDTFDADAVPGLRNILIKRTDFDFGEATEKSRLHVRYHTTMACHAELKASGENCITLTRILTERLLPALGRQVSGCVDGSPDGMEFFGLDSPSLQT